jgi:neutral ceramidase
MCKLRFCLLAGGFALLVAAAVPAVLAADAGPLRIGAAHVDVTPPAQPGQTIRDRLYASAIVMDNGATRAALIGVDTAGVGEAGWAAATKRIAEDLNCPVSNIIISSSHTHSGGGMGGPAPGARGAGAQPTGAAPSAAGRGGPSGPPADPGMVDRIVDAVRQANAALQPARMGFGTGMLNLNVNRDAIHPVTHNWYQGENLAAPSDKTLAVLKCETPAGEPIAFWVNYAMHPINFYLTGYISGDLPAQMARYVEEIYDNKVVVVFAQGAQGNQNPLYVKPMMDFRGAQQGFADFNWETVAGTWDNAPAGTPKPQKADVSPARVEKAYAVLDKWITAQGAIMGQEVLRVAGYTKNVVREASIWSGQKDISCPGRIRTDKGREGMTATYVDGPPVNMRVGLLRIGNVALVSVNGEVYNEIAIRLKRESPFANTVFAGVSNGGATTGYIPDDQSFSHNTFQVLGSRLKPGCAENAIVDGALELMRQSMR